MSFTVLPEEILSMIWQECLPYSGIELDRQRILSTHGGSVDHLPQCKSTKRFLSLFDEESAVPHRRHLQDLGRIRLVHRTFANSPSLNEIVFYQVVLFPSPTTFAAPSRERFDMSTVLQNVRRVKFAVPIRGIPRLSPILVNGSSWMETCISLLRRMSRCVGINIDFSTSDRGTAQDRLLSIIFHCLYQAQRHFTADGHPPWRSLRLRLGKADIAHARLCKSIPKLDLSQLMSFSVEVFEAHEDPLITLTSADLTQKHWSGRNSWVFSLLDKVNAGGLRSLTLGKIPCPSLMAPAGSWKGLKSTLRGLKTLRLEGMAIRSAGLKEFVVSLSGLEELRLVGVSVIGKNRVQNGEFRYDYSSKNMKVVFDAVREHPNRPALFVSFERAVVEGAEWSLAVDLSQPDGVQKRLAKLAHHDLYANRPLNDPMSNEGQFPHTDLALYLMGQSEWTPGLEARFQQQEGL